MDVVTRKAAALQANDIQTLKARSVAGHGAIGDDILFDAGHAADHGVFAHTDELMDRGQTANNCPFTNMDMSAQCGVVHQNDVIIDNAIVSNVRANHEQAVVSDPRQHAPTLGSWIHSYMFTNDIVATDLQPRGLAMIFEVLRSMPD